MIKILKPKVQHIEPDEIQKENTTTKILSTFRKKEEEEMASALAAELNLPYIDTNLIPISKDDIKLLTEEEARRLKIASIHRAGKIVTIISADPKSSETQEFLEKLKTEKGWQIKLFVVSLSNITRVWEKYKQIDDMPIQTKQQCTKQ